MSKDDNQIDFDFKKYEESCEKAFDEQSKEFEKIANEKLIISLIGSVNAGKSQTINALTGIKYTEVKAIAGHTKNISLFELKKNIFIADTPGLEDINENISKKASEFVEKNADIILYVINAASGLTSNIKQTYLELTKLNKKIIIVLNKIDTLDEDEIDDVVGQINAELNNIPIAISAKKDIGINKLNNEILSILKNEGKKLLFLKISKFKEDEVRKMINKATLTAAGIGALPIPGSDIFGLTTLQIKLAIEIASLYDIKPSKKDIMSLIGATITGQIGKQIARYAISTLKAAGWIPGGQLLEVAVSSIAATIAASLTYGFGWACNAYYKSGMTLHLNEIESIFNTFYDSYKKKKELEQNV